MTFKFSKQWAVIAVIGLLIISTYITWSHFIKTPLVTVSSGVKYKVKPGTSFPIVIRELNQQGVIKNPLLFAWLVYSRGQSNNLKAGEYLFPPGTTPVTLLEQVTKGRGMVLHPFNIIAGTTFQQVRQTLDKDPNVQHHTKALTDKAIMTKLNRPSLSPEGQFFPDTYLFSAGTSDIVLLKKAFDAMQKKLNREWGARSPEVIFKKPYDVLIAASIIEKEAYLDSERPIIAGVMNNRLQKNILLQMDPTVIYGLGKTYRGTIYRSDLLKDTPYNTYTRKGLPPTPIAMPGLASLKAVLHPQKNNYFYYVANEDKRSHQFSTSLIAHKSAVALRRVSSKADWVNNKLLLHYLQQRFLKTLPELN